MIGPQFPEVLRIQPVAPAPRTSEETGQLIGALLLLVPAVLAFTSWLVMLTFGTLHDLYPVVQPVGFWQSVTLVLGLNVLGGAFRARPWRWARR